MTPTSIGGEKQASISGGSQSPIWYSLRQDYRGAQLKYVMQLHDAHLATRMPEHSWISLYKRKRISTIGKRFVYETETMDGWNFP